MLVGAAGMDAVACASPASGYGAGNFGGGVGRVLIAALRDLQWRRRRFIIAIVGTGVVFAMTLVLTGLANGFRVEADGHRRRHRRRGLADPVGRGRPVRRLLAVPGRRGRRRARRWTASRRSAPSVRGHDGEEGSTPKNVNVFGAPPDGPGMPSVSEGKVPATADEVAVSSALDKDVGDQLEIGSSTLDVVGVVDDSTALAGTPNVFLTVEGAQR